MGSCFSTVLHSFTFRNLIKEIHDECTGKPGTEVDEARTQKMLAMNYSNELQYQLAAIHNIQLIQRGIKQK